MKIRRFESTDADYEGIVAVHNAACPRDQVSVELMRQVDSRRKPQFFFERYVGEIGGQMVATGAISHVRQSFRPNKYFIDWDSHPQSGAAVDVAFFDDLYGRLLARNPQRIESYVREDHAHRVARLNELGFRPGLVDAYSALHVPDFSFEAYSALPAHVATLGVQIVTLSEWENSAESDWKTKLEQAEWDLVQDVPHDEPFTRKTIDEWWELLSDPRKPHDGYFIALAPNREIIGVSYLVKGVQGVFYTGLTAVARDWRRKGIATMLKVRAIRYAHNMGAHTIQTDNEENNPMYALNIQLGFEPLPAWQEYIREF